MDYTGDNITFDSSFSLDSCELEAYADNERQEDQLLDLDISSIDPRVGEEDNTMMLSKTQDHKIEHNIGELTDFGKTAKSFGLNFENPPCIKSPEYYLQTIQGQFDRTITNVAKKLLESGQKNEEINTFKRVLLDGFQNWFLSNEMNKILNERNERYQNKWREISEEISGPIFEFVVYDKEINAFQLPFSDVFINVIVKDPRYKYNALECVANYLRERDPHAYIQEFLSAKKNYKKKIIFKFLKGKTNFILMVNIELHLRLHNLFKLYANVDERFLFLGTFLSYWAHRRGIFRDEYLNPQALYLMLLYFLMVQNPAILPKAYVETKNKTYYRKNLRGIKDRVYSNKISYNVYEEDPSRLKMIMQSQDILPNFVKKVSSKENLEKKQKILAETENTVTLGGLVTRFFYMYAFDIPALRKSISIKSGKLVEPKIPIDGYSVMDPFIEDFDLCRNLNSNTGKGFKAVHIEFLRAYALVYDGKTRELCQEFTG